MQVWSGGISSISREANCASSGYRISNRDRNVGEMGIVGFVFSVFYNYQISIALVVPAGISNLAIHGRFYWRANHYAKVETVVAGMIVLS